MSGEKIKAEEIFSSLKSFHSAYQNKETLHQKFNAYNKAELDFEIHPWPEHIAQGARQVVTESNLAALSQNLCRLLKITF